MLVGGVHRGTLEGAPEHENICACTELLASFVGQATGVYILAFLVCTGKLEDLPWLLSQLSDAGVEVSDDDVMV